MIDMAARSHLTPAVIGARLRVARERLGAAQHEIADALGVHQSQVSRIEAGACEMRVGQIERIAYAYRIKIEELLA